MTKGKVIDIATADESTVLDTFDMMATLGCSRDTIRLHMKKGIIPPALDRVGHRYRWTVGYLKEWNKIRTQKALDRLSKKKTLVKLSPVTFGSEFDLGETEA